MPLPSCRLHQKAELLPTLDLILDAAMEEYRVTFEDELAFSAIEHQQWWARQDARSQMLHLFGHLSIRLFDRMFEEDARIGLNNLSTVAESAEVAVWLEQVPLAVAN